jgi:hypothetical protein
MLDIKSLTMWAVSYEIVNKARAKSLSEAGNNDGGARSSFVHGRDSIHSIEQVRNKVQHFNHTYQIRAFPTYRFRKI